jgi:hypothetical protein
MVPEVALHLPQALCTVTSEEGQVRVTRLPSCPPEVPAGSAALPALLKRFGRLRVQPVRWGGGPGQLIESSEAGITITHATGDQLSDQSCKTPQHRHRNP